MNTIHQGSAVMRDPNATRKSLGNSQAIFEYWCLDCDEFFEVRELLMTCPQCDACVQDSLVHIYMEHDPEPDHYRNRSDFEGG